MSENKTELEQLKEDWESVLDADSAPKFLDETVKNHTARLLHNEQHALAEDSGTYTGDVQNWDPVLISLIRRTMPTLIAHDIIGVQPMTGPSGLIFAMHAWYGGDPAASGANEAFTSSEPDSSHTGTYSTADAQQLGADLEADTTSSPTGDVSQTNPWPEMSFSISKQTVSADSRALKAKYSNELAQDLKNIHGLDAETELANILSSEITAEINREIVSTVYNQAKPGAQNTSSPTGTYDLDSDADGRWAVEKYKELVRQIGHEAQQIAQQTRRGVGNWVITSASIANALDIAGLVDTSFTPGDMTVDPVGITFAGMLAGKFRLYIDPYATDDYVTVGYKGPNVYDAGYFYAPYVPLQFHKTVDSNSFQPVIGFKTRYGMTHNPFVSGSADQNPYYRRFKVTGL